LIVLLRPHTKTFLFGFAYWLVVCLLFDLLAQMMAEMTGVSGVHLLFTTVTACVFGYFAIGFVTAMWLLPWRRLLCGLAHAVLVASFALAAYPHEMNSLLAIGAIIYFALFIPWMISWYHMVSEQK
jgi:hypothetical protein